MRFAEATADDIQQVIAFIDAHETLPSSVTADLDDWIHDTPGDHLWSSDIPDIVSHLTRLWQNEEAKTGRW